MIVQIKKKKKLINKNYGMIGMSLCKECQYCRLLHGDMWEIFENQYVWGCDATWNVSATLDELYKQCPWGQ